MEKAILKWQLEGSTGLIRIERPEALNALNTRFFEEMNDLLDEAGQIENLTCLVITGTGKAFVAGADIAEMAGMTDQEATHFSQFGQRTFRRLEEFPVPVIAAINGFALGGGLELALACDFRFASSLSKFGQPEVNLGLIPGYAATQRLSRLIGKGNALFLLVTGEMIDANEALRMGIIQRIFEPTELEAKTMAVANQIGSKGKKAVAMVKKISQQGLETSFTAGCEMEAQAFGSLFGSPEATEGMQAFLEKRKPNWK